MKKGMPIPIEAKIALFNYDQHLYDHYCRSDQKSLCVQLPLDVIIRIQEYRRKGMTQIYGKEIHPIFFTKNPKFNKRVMDQLTTTGPDSFQDFIRRNVFEGDSVVWIFAERKIICTLEKIFHILSVPDIYVYEPSPDDMLKICELSFRGSRKRQEFLPVLDILEHETVCKN